MLRGKMYYKNKKIKYFVVMKEYESGMYIFIKTRLDKFTLSKLELILDCLKSRDEICDNKIEESEYNLLRNEFLNKWNKMSNKDIVKKVETFIKNLIDDVYVDRNIENNIKKEINSFNGKEKYYSKGLPMCDVNIPMPEVKPSKYKATKLFIDLKDNDKDINVFSYNDSVTTIRAGICNKIIKQYKTENGYTYERNNENEEWIIIDDNKLTEEETNKTLISLKKSLTTALVKKCDNKLTYEQCENIASKFMDNLDFNNSALMHKGINCYAKEILSRIDFEEIK